MKYWVWPLRHGAIAPSFERLIGVGDHQLGVDLERGAETVALLARAVGELNEKLRGAGSS